MEDWRKNILEDDDQIANVVRHMKRVAVLGIKTEAQNGAAAYYVPEYLASVGVEVIPVPVYFPETKEILGQQVHRKLAEVPGPIDVVDVFRRPSDVPAHVDDILAAKPKVVWLQSGIRNDAVAETLARAGISVVQDRCLMVDHRLYAHR